MTVGAELGVLSQISIGSRAGAESIPFFYWKPDLTVPALPTGFLQPRSSSYAASSQPRSGSLYAALGAHSLSLLLLISFTFNGKDSFRTAWLGNEVLISSCLASESKCSSPCNSFSPIWEPIPNTPVLPDCTHPGVRHRMETWGGSKLATRQVAKGQKRKSMSTPESKTFLTLG